jgi:hypothetical protein
MSGRRHVEHLETRSAPPKLLSSTRRTPSGDAPRGARGHTWDIVVMSDPAATIAPDAVDPMMTTSTRRRGIRKAGGGAVKVRVVTTDPARRFRLSVSDAVKLTRASAAPAAAALPSESLICLVYGRLDPDHTRPTISADGVDLGILKATCPGF